MALVASPNLFLVCMAARGKKPPCKSVRPRVPGRLAASRSRAPGPDRTIRSCIGLLPKVDDVALLRVTTNKVRIFGHTGVSVGASPPSEFRLRAAGRITSGFHVGWTSRSAPKKPSVGTDLEVHPTEAVFRPVLPPCRFPISNYRSQIPRLPHHPRSPTPDDRHERRTR